MGKSPNVDDVKERRQIVFIRLAGVFGDHPSKKLLVLPSHGSQFHHRVSLKQPPLLRDLKISVVQFLDESQEVQSHYTNNDTVHEPMGSRSTSVTPDCSPGGPSLSLKGIDNHHTPVSTIHPTEALTVLSLLNVESPIETTGYHSSVSIIAQSSLPVPIEPDISNTFVYQQPPGAPVLWPLEHEQEAMLLQHYIDNVALFVRLPRHSIDFQVDHH
jgi:hypothetical protein